MAQLIGLDKREALIALQEQGVSMYQISVQELISYGSVKGLINRYKKEGISGLIPKYSSCGQTRSYESECSYRLVRLYKHYHCEWGVGYILMKIKEKYPQLKLCVSRTYERRLKSENITSLVKNPPLQYEYHSEAARLPHDIWQIDGKEQLKTLDGQATCYLTVSDEKTGCLLETKVFSLRLYESSTHRTSAPISIANV